MNNYFFGESSVSLMMNHVAGVPQHQRKKKKKNTPPGATLKPRGAPSAVFAAGALDSPPELTAFPYPHTSVGGLFDRSVLLSVRDELASLHRTFKETDLFKVFQTGDLANIDPTDLEHARSLPQMIRLRAALYSPAFRAWVSKVTGCAELTEQQDCSCNVYGHGGHLLCHDDVIGTRCAFLQIDIDRKKGGSIDQ